jgi:acyl-CoA thioesterase I
VNTRSPHRSFRRLCVGLLLSLLCVPAWAGQTSVAEEERPRIVAFGDSLTAGLGVSADNTYPAQLQQRLEGLNLRYRVVNAGVSGETTAGALRRVPWILSGKPRLVILESGANDGLRGLDLRQTKDNLAHIIEQFKTAGVTVVLAGMKLPPNYGDEYAAGFEAMYPALAKHHQVPLIPFFLQGVAASTTLNQADGIHPTKEGYKIIVEEVLKTLRPLLAQNRAKP